MGERKSTFLTSTPFWAIICCLLWSSAFVFIKLGVVYSAPLQFAGMRFFLAGLMLVPLVPVLSGVRWGVILRACRGSWFRLALLGLFQIGLQYAFFYVGLSFIPAALGAMLQGAGPLIAALVAHVMVPGDRLTPRKILALVIGFSGVIVLTLGRNAMGSLGDLALLGIVLVLCNSVISAVGNVIVARVSQRIAPTLISSSSMLSGGLALLLVGWGVEGLLPLPQVGEFYLSLLALCVISAGALSIWYTLLRRPTVQVSMLNTWKFIIPLMGAVLAWLVLPDEHPTVVALLGMLLIVVSLLVLYWPRRMAATVR